MTATLKPGISRAKRMVMARRLPISVLIEKQRARVDKLTERIGHLMTQRVDEEEVLAELYAMEQGRNPTEKTPTPEDWERAERRAKRKPPTCSYCGDPTHRLADCPELARKGQTP